MPGDIFRTFHQSAGFQRTRLQPGPGRPLEMPPSEKCESVERIKVRFCSIGRIFLTVCVLELQRGRRHRAVREWRLLFFLQIKLKSIVALKDVESVNNAGEDHMYITLLF